MSEQAKPSDAQAPEAGAGHGRKAGTFALALGSVGVVFGDIGTSPLYAFKQALAAASGDGVAPAEIFGIISLALWAMILVVTVKYVFLIMRADNKGEGGVLSLMALAQRAIGRRTRLMFVLGMLGAALFYGDAVITPAMTVLSAAEGIKTIPAFKGGVPSNAILALAGLILIVLFFIQSRGTAKVARLFSPICILWFLTMAALGVAHFVRTPEILMAFSPHYAVSFLLHHGFIGFIVLGAVFLTVTGAEALTADMGHFGRWPIQAGWLFFVFPCLVLNYLGQGAFALESLAATPAGQPFINRAWFFEMAPEALRLPLVILSLFASVVASQAVITGAFSLTQQAIQLGLLPRIDIKRTSETQSGQIYVPQINTFLLVAVMGVMLTFQSSEGLGHAYGLSVTGTMIVTTCMAFIVARHKWNWSLWLCVILIGPLFLLDLTFVGANAMRFFSGGWLPLAIAAALVIIMWTWVKGSQILTEKTRKDSIPLVDLVDILKARAPHRCQGTAIFLTSDVDATPVALMHNLKHNKVLHEKNIILTVRTAETPRVKDENRVEVEPLNDDFKKVILTYGFMESPNVPKALAQMRKKQGVKFDIMTTSFFLGRRSVVPSANSGMPLWQDKLFIFLMKNAANPTDFFRIPYGRVVELGAQVTV